MVASYSSCQERPLSTFQRQRQPSKLLTWCLDVCPGRHKIKSFYLTQIHSAAGEGLLWGTAMRSSVTGQGVTEYKDPSSKLYDNVLTTQWLQIGRAELQSWKEDLTLIWLYLKFQSQATNTTRECLQINVFSGLHLGYLLFCKISMRIFMLVLTSSEFLYLFLKPVNCLEVF